MKHKSKFIIATAVMLLTMMASPINAWATDETFSYADYTGQGTQSSGSVYTMEKTDVNITNTKFYGNNSYAHFYANGTTTITPASGVTITQIVLTASSNSYNGYQSSGTITASTGSVSGSGTTITWTGSATTAFTISNNKQIRWTSIVVTYSSTGGGSTPSISANDVNIAYDATGGSIAYTLNNATGNVTANITSGDWLTLGVITESEVPFTCSANEGGERTATVTLSYTGANDKVVTITQDGAPTVSTPTFSPVAGTYYGTQNVIIACTTDGATIYYTLDGTDPTESSSVYLSPIEVSETTTIKALATKSEYNNSAIASATYTISDPIAGYNINFEAPANAYTDWTFTNMESQQTGNANVTAHGGTYYGTTGGKATASIQTKQKIDNPGTLTCYVTKQSTNTTSSTWYIQVSSDGSSWTNANTQSATSMDAGTWVEFSADLTSYSNVYVRVYYSGSTAVRNIDDLTLTISNTFTVTYNANGATSGTVPTDNNVYESGDEVTVLGNTGSLAKAGYTFGGWNTQTDGLGTNYTVGNTFEITSNTTLYAKWNAKVITGLSYTGTPTKIEYFSGESFDPTGLTVTATFDDSSEEEVTALVTWTPDPLTTGTTAVTGTYMGQTINVTGLTVTAAPGTEDNPYTVAQARANIDAGTGMTGVYVTGIVYEGGSSLSSGAMNYWISDDGTATDKFEIYKGKSFSGNNFTSTNEVQPGDDVVVYGNITKYNTTYEFAQGSTLQSLKLVAPTFSPAAGAVDEGTEITISDAHTDATIYYTTDGTTPTNESTVYNSGNKPTITGAITLKAIAVKSGCTTSDVVSAAYTIEEHAATPTFSPATNVVYTTAQNVTISCETEGATIYYTTDGTTPTNESTVYSSAIPVSVTTTIKAIAVKAGMANSSVAEATYTISLTTMDAIFAKATDVGSTATSVYITFNNWVITGVNTSKHAFLSDGEKGCIIYVDNHGGFSEGDILSGTANCNVQLFNASAELTNITTTTEGLTVTPGLSPISRVTTIDALGAINSGSLVTLKDLTYNGSTLSDGVNTITPYNTIFSATLTNGNTYDVTGVFVLNSTTKRINPRRAEDIVLKANISDTDFSGLTSFAYVVGNGPSAAQSVDILGEDFAGDLTITASADYEVSTDNSTYTSSVVLAEDEGNILETLYIRLKSGLSAGTHNGTLTMTATNITTVVVDLTGSVSATVTYTITLNQNTGGVISANKGTAEAGETVTLSVNLDDCYNFTGWTVLDGSANEVTVTDNHFTMPASDVEVEATFSQKQFTISYSVNGIVENVLEEDVTCGNNASLWDADDLEAVDVFAPSGYTLAGWSTSESSTETVNSFTPTENTTLYAVFKSGSLSYELVTSANNITAGKYLFGAFRSTTLPSPIAYYIANGTINSGDIVVTATSYQPTENRFTTIPDGGVEMELTGNNTDGFVISYNSQSLGYTSYENRKIAFGNYDSYLWKFFDKNNGLSTGAIYMVCNYNDNSYTVSENSTGTGALRGYANTTSYRGFYLFKKNEPVYFTRITNITSTQTRSTAIPANERVVVSNNSVFTLSAANNGTSANLIIKDGAQLYNNSSVAVTVQKEIAGYTEASGSDADGWYLIASPLTSTAASAVTTGTYDLYTHDEAAYMWRNYKYGTNATSYTWLANGYGYLYANAADQTLSFTGTLAADGQKVVNLAYGSNANAGWNLLGNHTAHNVSVSMSNGATSIKVMDASGIDFEDALIATTEIAPCQGFFVKATAESQTATVNPTAKAGALSHQTFARLKLTDNSVPAFGDVAYVTMEGGLGSENITLSEVSPQLYIPINGTDYSVASVAEGTTELPLNLKATSNTSYTINLSFVGTPYEHVVLHDLKTGVYTDLLVSDYTFAGVVGDSDYRFRLIFAAGDDPDGVSENSVPFAYQSGNELIMDADGTLQIIDVLGRVLTEREVSGSSRVSTAGLTKGTYILRMTTESGVRTQKIVVK